MADLLLRVPSARLKTKFKSDVADKEHASDFERLHAVAGHISHPRVNSVRSRLKRGGMEIQNELYFQSIPTFVYKKLPLLGSLRLLLYRLDSVALSSAIKGPLREFLGQRLILARKSDARM